MSKKLVIFVVLAVMIFLIGCSAPPQQPEAPPEDKPAAVETPAEEPTPEKTVSAEDQRKANELTKEASKLAMKSETYTEAIEKAEEALEVNPNEIEAYRIIARVHRNKNDYSKAMDSIEAALKLDSKNTDLYEDKATTQKGRREYGEAIETYEEILKIKPDDDKLVFNTMANIASAYTSKNEHDKAEEWHQKIVEKYPDDYKSYELFANFWKTRSYRFHNDKEKRLDALQKCADYYAKAFDNLGEDNKFWEPGTKYRVAEAYYLKWKVSEDDADKQKSLDLFKEYKEIKPDHVFMSSADKMIEEMKGE